MSRRGHGRSASRTVGYEIETAAPNEPAIDEAPLTRLLDDAIARGIVPRGQYDTGRGRFLWFNGWPGKELRKLRARVLATVARLRGARPR